MSDDQLPFRLPEQQLSSSADRQIRKRLQQADRQRHHASGGLWFRMMVVALLMIAVLPGGVWSLRQYVYYNPAITSGNTLYSFKRAIEVEVLSTLQKPAERSSY